MNINHRSKEKDSKDKASVNGQRVRTVKVGKQMNPKIAKQVMIRQTSKTPQLLADPFSQIQIEEKEKKALKKNLKLKSNYQQIQKAKSSD